MVPGFCGGVTGVKEAGSVEITCAPSPMLRPITVSVKGRPISAPRGCSSVITGDAASAA